MVYSLPHPLSFTEEGENQGEILQVREGPEVSERQKCIKLYSA